MSQYISKGDLLTWLDKVRGDRDLVAPVRVDDLVLFRKVGRAEDIVFDYVNTDISPKGEFFPQSEAVFSVDRRDGQVELVPTAVERGAVIFGIRPCDAKGIAALDKPYLDDPADALYREHRDKTTLIGLSCLAGCGECFCTSMGTGPDDGSNVDIMLTEAGEGYIVKVLTDKGKALMPDGLLSSKEVSAPAAPEVKAVPSEGIVEKMREVFEDEYWGRLADRCLHCNVCSYVCPTCYCFDMRDYSNKGKVERVRSWESCQAPGFTKIAGGYDPRAAKGSRLRQRFAHKLLYFPERYGEVGCVGCGRCVRACPVNIDIREVIEDVQGLGVKSEA
jgi:sulfhydrogenase subunit beta (sulfur reductase)